MDIPLYRCNDKRRHLLSIVLLLQHRLEIINGKFHGICTGNQLRQEIFFLFKNSPTLLMAAISWSLMISSGFAPSAIAFFTSSIMLPLFPFKTAVVTGSAFSSTDAVPPAAPSFSQQPSHILPFPLPVYSYARCSGCHCQTVQQHVRSKCGIHQKFLRRIGNRHGKPRQMAMVRNAVLTKLLSGRPNEIFDRPQIVGSFLISLQ